MASFSLCIKSAPNSQGSLHGLEFARSCVKHGHSLVRVFFYGEGVLIGLKTQIVPQGETCISTRWEQFLLDNKIDAVICISAAMRRGVLDSQEAARQGFSFDLLREGFTLSGLGQWVAANSDAEHSLTFG